VRAVEPVPLPRERFGAAAEVMADAFLDDPGWAAVGPDSRARRHAYIRRVGLGSLRLCERAGGPIWQVEHEGRVAGVLSGVDPGGWPPPQLRGLAYQAAGPIIAGPGVLVRSLSADGVLHRGHPAEPHLFVWMLAVAPDQQRRGIGRSLLSTALDRADGLGVPAYLDTAKPDNVPYYASFGFEEVGLGELPRGAHVWFMQRGMAS
jgi:GNAT superfamily N-acetyltransferase